MLSAMPNVPPHGFALHSRRILTNLLGNATGPMSDMGMGLGRVGRRASRQEFLAHRASLSDVGFDIEKYVAHQNLT